VSHLFELLPPAALLALELLLSAAVAVRISRAATTEGDSLAVAGLVTIVVGIAQVVGIMSLLGWVGLMSTWPVAVAHLAVAGVVFATVHPKARPAKSMQVDSFSLAVAAACIAPGALATALGLMGRSLEADTVHYHLVNAAQWLRTGSIVDLGYAAPGFFTATHPGNGELLAAWAMLPTHMDQLAYLMPVVFGVMAVLGVIVAVEECGGDIHVGALGAVALVASPLVFFTQVHGLETDLSAASGVIAAIGLGLRARRQPELRRWPLLAGVALGLGVGSKYSATLPSIAVLAFLGACVPSGRLWSWERLRLVALAVAGAAVFGGSWYVRNLFVAHDPVFPQTARLDGIIHFTGGSSPLYDAGVSLLNRAAHFDGTVIGGWAGDAAGNLGPALALVIVGLTAPLWLPKARAAPVWGLSLVGVACLVAYMATPTTGGIAGLPGGFSRNLVASNIRYALPALMIGVVVAATTLARAVAYVVAGLALAFDAIKILGGPGFRTDMQVTGRSLLLFLVFAAVATAGWLALNGAPEEAIARVRGWNHRVAGRFGLLVAVAAGSCLALALMMATEQSGQPSSDTVTVALARVATADPVVAVVDVNDVAALLGPRLDRHVVAVGSGETGLEQQFTDPAQFDQKLRQLHASVVVVENGPHTVASSRPAGWSAPSTWVDVGREGNAEVYVTGIS
jgi:hypothetical protein